MQDPSNIMAAANLANQAQAKVNEAQEAVTEQEKKDQ
jgi:hypothetical protein